MLNHLPRRYTVLITTSGQTPTTLTVRPLPILVVLLAAIAAPTAWVMSLLLHNEQLAERNEELSKTASEVLVEIDSLDEEIETLKDRAGVEADENPLTPRSEVPAVPQGGPAASIDPLTALEVARQKVPALEETLDRAVKPALEETLAAEAERRNSFPDGLPLDGPLNISSEFGLRSNPFGGRNFELHSGIDFTGPVGQPILATADGVVEKSERGRGYGLYVRIDHGFGHDTLYAHLSELKVEVGDEVRRGEVIGSLGNTGRSTGPHLHYSVYRNDEAVNPRYYLKLTDGEG